MASWDENEDYTPFYIKRYKDAVEEMNAAWQKVLEYDKESNELLDAIRKLIEPKPLSIKEINSRNEELRELREREALLARFSYDEWKNYRMWKDEVEYIQAKLEECGSWPLD